MQQYQYDTRIQIHVLELEAKTICNWPGISASHCAIDDPKYFGNHRVTFYKVPSPELQMRLKLYLDFDIDWNLY